MKLREPKEWDALTAAMSQTIAQNLTAALLVAGGSPDSVKKMALANLHSKTKISKSTLFKLVNEKGEAKPDLETLCGLAWALNLPPAFLLMSSNDWQRLIGAINGLPLALSSHHLDELDTAMTDIGMASIGLKLAKELAIYSENDTTKLQQEKGWPGHAKMVKEIKETNEKQRLAILTTTAVTQRYAKRNVLAMLTAIGAIFGANFKSI